MYHHKTLTYLSFFFVLLIFVFFVPSSIYARQGCCSSHGGVCGCGCCDGTSLSSTCAPYYPECNNRAPIYIPPVNTPTSRPITIYTPKPTATPIPKSTVTQTPTPTVLPTIELTQTQKEVVLKVTNQIQNNNNTSFWDKILSFFSFLGL